MSKKHSIYIDGKIHTILRNMFFKGKHKNYRKKIIKFYYGT